jgi:hypothetical protein
MDFKQFKNRSQTNISALTEKLLKESESQNSKSYSENLNEFKLVPGKDGNAKAIIRFLPDPADPEGTFYVQLYNHGFKVGNKWLIENCPTTPGINLPCPICESNVELWASGNESDKRMARERKRKLSYYANIYVVKNPADPSQEGQVKLFRFGQRIKDKILAAAKPEFEGDEEILASNYWHGANFRLISKTVKTTLNGKEVSLPNYDDSGFENKSVFMDGDDELLEKVHNQLFNIRDIVDPSKFKSYDELKKRFYSVTQTRQAVSMPSVEEQEQELDELLNPKEDILAELESSYSKAKETSLDEDEEDEDLKRFMALAEG